MNGTLADTEADSAAGDETRVHVALLSLTGVGAATASVLMMGQYGRPSIDSATLRVAAEQWFDGRRPTPREVARRVAAAGPYAGLVVARATLRSWQRTEGLIDA